MTERAAYAGPRLCDSDRRRGPAVSAPERPPRALQLNQGPLGRSKTMLPARSLLLLVLAWALAGCDSHEAQSRALRPEEVVKVIASMDAAQRAQVASLLQPSPAPSTSAATIAHKCLARVIAVDTRNGQVTDEQFLFVRQIELAGGAYLLVCSNAKGSSFVNVSGDCLMAEYAISFDAVQHQAVVRSNRRVAEAENREWLVRSASLGGEWKAYSYLAGYKPPEAPRELETRFDCGATDDYVNQMSAASADAAK